jgi:hypothetical protein
MTGAFKEWSAVGILGHFVPQNDSTGVNKFPQCLRAAVVN